MVKEIISKMTFEEKATMLTYYDLLDTVANEKYDIPMLVMADGPHGVRPLRGTPEHIKGGSTAFPTASALSATWNRELAYKTGAGIARDCIAQNVDVILGPGVNIKRTPLCGRNFEYFSEDPTLAGEIGAEYIKGCEEQGVGTCLKHYALNNQETIRTTINVEVDERTLREIYLKPFEICVKKGKPASIMAAYNRALGECCTQNKKLFDILRDEWDFDGAIISDWTAVKDVAGSFAAGLNLQMPCNKNIVQNLKDGIADGRITQEQIDNVLEEYINFVFRISNAEKCKDEFDRQRQHNDAYEVASEAITLLKNENDILPITKEKYKKLFVLGGWAEKPHVMGGGSSIVHTKEEMIETPLEMIKKNAGDDFEVIYNQCYSDVDKGNIGETLLTARKCISDCTDEDLVICFISTPVAETEALDRYSLHFENYIDNILTRLANFAKNVVVVMQTGSAYAPYSWDSKVKGIVQMWLAGEAGGSAIADVLFGKVNPSGKLAETFPKKLRDDFVNVGMERKITYTEGFNVGYRYYDKHTEDIWYPFGHGLSYTEYEYSNLSTAIEGDNLKISLDVKNIGKVDGKETVQIYIGKELSFYDRPIKELKGFTKVELKSGETKNVEILIPLCELAVYNVASSEWKVEAGKYQLYVGASSQDIRLTDSFEI